MVQKKKKKDEVVRGKKGRQTRRIGELGWDGATMADTNPD